MPDKHDRSFLKMQILSVIKYLNGISTIRAREADPAQPAGLQRTVDN